ncbi:MAG: HD domain-containing protein [Planctomycetia bacterium]|nr:HD domain-containing protein [Planctomycetia bacterium]
MNQSKAISTIPEMIELDAKTTIIRVPPEIDVPLTRRVRKIIDSTAFRRLTEINQLGFVALVYPGARHTRFEHSLGVYRLALLVLKRLLNVEAFCKIIHREEAELLIVTALLHDIGHYPFCHLIEDIYPPQQNDSEIDDCIKHEKNAQAYIISDELAQILRRDWHLNPEDVLCLLNEKEVKRRENENSAEFQRRQKAYRLLMSILSGPIDIDKMDYLARDSLGAGVPYGRHFDQDRLIGSLCLNRNNDGLAITEKGKTAAELMVFARYVMFSEVYWHHAVRSATVMLQRAFDIISQFESPLQLIKQGKNASESVWIKFLQQLCRTKLQESARKSNSNEKLQAAIDLLDGILGTKRSLYKRVRQFSITEEPSLYEKLAGRPYFELQTIADKLIERINQVINQNGQSKTILCPNDLLIDAPPVNKEVQFKIDVYYPNENRYLPLSSVSPVVRALAEEQFDDYVKRVRIFAKPSLSVLLKNLPQLNQIIKEC